MKHLLLGTLLITATHLFANTRTDENKKIVKNFYEMAFVEHKPKEAAETYISADTYIQHNPHVPNGRKAFIDYFVPYFAKNKVAPSEIKRIVAEGDLVMLHVHARKSATDPGRALVDIFRVKDGKIVEHWDVMQNVVEKTANGNAMF